MSIKASGFRRKAIGNSACIHVIGMQNQNQQAEVHAQTKRLHSLRMGWLLLSSIASLRAHDRLYGFLDKTSSIHLIIPREFLLLTTKDSDR